MKFNKKQKFSIRKYAFGAASVLIGTVIVGTHVSADSTTTDTVSTVVKAEESTVSTSTDSNAASTSTDSKTESTSTDSNSEDLRNQLDSAIAEAEIISNITSQTVSKGTTSTNEAISEENKAELKEAATNINIAVKEAQVLVSKDELDELEVKNQVSNLNLQIEAAYILLKKNGFEELSYSLDTVSEPSAEAQRDHYKQYQGTDGKNKHLKDLNQQLFFIDWSDESAVTGAGRKIQANGSKGIELIEGTTWTKEISPGYIVKVKVKELKNILGQNNGQELKEGSKVAEVAESNPFNGSVFAQKENYNNYSEISKSGLTAPGYSTIAGELGLKGLTQKSGSHTNLGITFEVSATYNGKDIKPNIFMTSSESLSPTEAEIYKTNGTPWELLTELTNSDTKSSYLAMPHSGADSLAKSLYNISGYTDPNDPETKEKISNLTEKVLNKGEITSSTVATAGKGKNSSDPKVVDGLGTKTFGPYSNAGKYSKPIVLTKGVTETTLYLVSAGAQASTIGVAIFDEGDAPDSYGKASHFVSAGRDGKVTHPYIGSIKGDVDDVDPNGNTTPWTRDETNDTVDEGPKQLMGDSVEKNDNYTLHKSNDSTYTLKILANPNGNPQSYVKGWVDFNNNGVFDENEASDLITVTSAGEISLTFNNIPQNIDTTHTRLGMRIRTAKDAEDIANPTGIAYSGEVEDFQIQQTIPPRGELKRTEGKQGETQTSQLNFTAYGQLDYNVETNNTIDNTKPYKFVVNGVESDETTLTVANQGTYTLNPSNGVITFQPLADFYWRSYWSSCSCVG
ncbi:MAG: CshA/CshB family fibrillar adhesin-related protein [Streptococcus sp.]|nr:CshA/CshB family fibrillar adhesin-related protein [Streptococcus sp.]